MAINFRRLHAHRSRVIAFSFLYDTECWTHIIVEHMFRFKITGKVKSFSCLLWWYLLHCWNFCNQTWYDDAASVCYSHFEVTVRAQAIKYSCFCHIYWTAVHFAADFNWLYTIISRTVLWRLLSRLRFKTYISLFNRYLCNQTRCVYALLLLNKPSTNKVPRSGELCMQKLKSLLFTTQNLKVLPLKPGVGQYIALDATLTARDFFYANFYPSNPFTCIFPKPLLSSSCVGCGEHWFLCGPTE